MIKIRSKKQVKDFTLDTRIAICRSNKMTCVCCPAAIDRSGYHCCVFMLYNWKCYNFSKKEIEETLNKEVNIDL